MGRPQDFETKPAHHRANEILNQYKIPHAWRKAARHAGAQQLQHLKLLLIGDMWPTIHASKNETSAENCHTYSDDDGLPFTLRKAQRQF
jgi:hypothetical protein